VDWSFWDCQGRGSLRAAAAAALTKRKAPGARALPTDRRPPQAAFTRVGERRRIRGERRRSAARLLTRADRPQLVVRRLNPEEPSLRQGDPRALQARSRAAALQARLQRSQTVAWLPELVRRSRAPVPLEPHAALRGMRETASAFRDRFYAVRAPLHDVSIQPVILRIAENAAVLAP
jgi:hypothetical protein